MKDSKISGVSRLSTNCEENISGFIILKGTSSDPPTSKKHGTNIIGINAYCHKKCATNIFVVNVRYYASPYLMQECNKGFFQSTYGQHPHYSDFGFSTDRPKYISDKFQKGSVQNPGVLLVKDIFLQIPAPENEEQKLHHQKFLKVPSFRDSNYSYSC